MRDWFFVRHGPTHAKGMIGWTDLPADLSDTAQVNRLARFLPADAVVVSSDLLRAEQTADAVLGSRPRLPSVADLREMHFGEWEGRHHADVEAESPDHIFEFWDQPGDIAPPGGESWNSFKTRVDGAVDALSPDGPIVVVAHFGVILTQVQRAMGLTARQAFAHKIDNLSVTHIVEKPDRWQVEIINHLP